MTPRQFAEQFPPGDFLKEELEARGWTQADLAEILGRPPRVVNEIIAGKRSVTPETAKGLGAAFDTGPEFWMNLESAFQLFKVREHDNAVARRAKLYSKAPITEIARRGWIEHSANVDVLEKRLLGFLELKTLDEQPKPWPHAARKSTSYEHITPAQLVWLCRARQFAKATRVRPFSDQRFDECLGQLRNLLHSVEEVRHVPKVLAEAGIRLLVIEPLKGTRIDGACFWLAKDAPVIVVSMRFDRIDWFWHTLFHELGHVRNKDGRDESPGSLDVDLVGEAATKSAQKPAAERKADEFAGECLIPNGELDNLIARVRPLYSTEKIMGFATRVRVHPGIVVGRLQFRGEISYAHSRKMLEKVRHVIIRTALTDGWGTHAPALN